jgi:hypothetical protein
MRHGENNMTHSILASVSTGTLLFLALTDAAVLVILLARQAAASKRVMRQRGIR